MDALSGSADLDSNNAPVDPFKITREQYMADRYGKTRGTTNPSVMDKPYWKYMIAKGGNAYSARILFEGEGSISASAVTVWCFDRFGATVTVLPDGRHVYIGGEHEDFYDPDFCIYNDVVVLEGVPSLDLDPAALSAVGDDDDNDNEDDMDEAFHLEFTLRDELDERAALRSMLSTPEKITIYGYPEDVFPPTDFHTSTYHRDPATGKEVIYIIGGLGYDNSPHRDDTHVYQLHLSDFSITKLETSGAKPAGGTDGHKAELVVHNADHAQPAIKVTTKDGQDFSLLLGTLEWISHGPAPELDPLAARTHGTSFLSGGGDSIVEDPKKKKKMKKKKKKKKKK